NPDPLANQAAVERHKSYKPEALPALFINGLPAKKPLAETATPQEWYETLRKALDAGLEPKAEAKIDLKVDKPVEGAVAISATASVSKEGDYRLHFAVVEDMVRYPGRSGLRVHYNIVRDMPTPMQQKEVLIKGKDQPVMVSVSVKPSALVQSLKSYLDMYGQTNKFPGEERPLELKKLKVVAFIQDVKTGEVLQAVQKELPPAGGE